MTIDFSQQLCHDQLQNVTRRHFLNNCSTGLGALWLAMNGSQKGMASETASATNRQDPHFQPRAKRVIFLHMAGAPSQLELFDFKPNLQQLDGKPCPQSFLEGKRFAFIQGVPDMLAGQYPFEQVGESGAWVSDRLPHFKSVVDEVCFIKSMHTDQFNHAPAQFLFHTGSPNLGSPSAGSWITYGLGSENKNLPGYIVLVSGGKVPSAGKSIWGSGYLPSNYQGVQCRSQGDPVLFLSNPEGTSPSMRRRALDAMQRINQETFGKEGDAETLTRIAQYEMAFRMQTSAAEAFDLRSETQSTHDLYGTELGKESFANNCLLARRLAERDVRFIQLFHWGWDSHGSNAQSAINVGFRDRCQEIDKPMTALLTDLKQRGLLEETLVVWGGEFGRTPMRENRQGVTMEFIGRDHNPGVYDLDGRGWSQTGDHLRPDR